MDNLHWLVCYDVEADGKKQCVVCAAFDYLIHAEDFVMYCLPKENRKRFYFMHVDQYKPQ